MSTATLSSASRIVHLCNGEGIEFPKAVILSEIARCFSCEVCIVSGYHRADARNIPELLNLMAEPGCEVVLEADGFESEEALNLVEDLLEHPF
jgi:phosphotransferase system HPr-like phosphotransfer protein